MSQTPRIGHTGRMAVFAILLLFGFASIASAQATFQTITNYQGYIIGNRPVVTAWYGDRVAIVIDGETAAQAQGRDLTTMSHILDTFDKVMDTYDEIVGRVPNGSPNLNGRMRIEVSSLVGGGLANHGISGIGVGDGFFNGLYDRVGQGINTYDQVFFYETARNYWFANMNPGIDYATSTNDASWGWWTVGFNNAMSIFVPQQRIDGLDDMYYFNQTGKQFSDRMEANLTTYLSDPKYTWDNSWNVDRVPWDTNVSVNDLMTGLLVRMYKERGGIQFIHGLYREIPKLTPLAGWPLDRQGARDNFYLAASRAADDDLHDYFANTLKWPLSASADPFGDFTWTGNSNNRWDIGGNWVSDNAASTPNATYALAHITGNANTAIDLRGNRTVWGIRFNPQATAGFTVSNSTPGASLSITDGGSIIKEANGTTSNQTIASPLTLLGDVTLTNNNNWVHQANKLIVSGPISGSHKIFIKGNGDGGVELSADNSGFTGTIQLDSGMLLVSHNRALGDTSGGTIINGGALWLGGSVVTPENFTIAGNSTQSSLDSSGMSGSIEVDDGVTWTITNGGGNPLALTGALAGGGNVTLQYANTTLGGAGSNSLTGKIVDASNTSTAAYNELRLAKTGGAIAIAGILEMQNRGVVVLDGDNQIADAATVILNGANTVFRLNGHSDTIGALAGGAEGTGLVENENGGAGILTVTTSSGTATFSGVLRDGDGTGDDGKLGFTKKGAGTQVLSGNNTYTGPTAVSQGVLRAGRATNAFGNASPVSVAAGATLRLNGFGQTIGSLSGAGVVENGSSSSTTTLKLAGDDQDTTFSGVLSDGSSRSMGLQQAGSGKLILTGINTYTGPTSITSGVISIDLNGSVNQTSGITLNGGTLLVNSLVALNRAITFTGGTLGGTGHYANNLAVNSGHLSPGNTGAGLFSIDGALMLNALSALDFELSDLAGTNDRLNVSGALILDGTLNITNLGGMQPGIYTLIAGFSSLSDNGLALGIAPAAMKYAISTDASHVYLTVTAVPEPGALSLFAGALAASLGFRRPSFSERS
jgi:autotransporter-associated beta strand protein